MHVTAYENAPAHSYTREGELVGFRYQVWLRRPAGDTENQRLGVLVEGDSKHIFYIHAILLHSWEGANRQCLRVGTSSIGSSSNTNNSSSSSDNGNDKISNSSSSGRSSKVYVNQDISTKSYMASAPRTGSEFTRM